MAGGIAENKLVRVFPESEIYQSLRQRSALDHSVEGTLPCIQIFVTLQVLERPSYNTPNTNCSRKVS